MAYASDHMLHSLSTLFPRLGGAIAYHRFCTPRLSQHRSGNHDALVERARFHLRDATPLRVATSQGDVQAYVLDPASAANGTSVLVIHGWTGEASFMSAFAEHSRRRGFRAVLLDLPAHGRSAGKQTSLIGCAHAVREVAEALGPIHFVIAHSIGGLAALLAGSGGPPMPHPYPFSGFVLVAMPNRFAEVTRRFGVRQGLTPQAQRDYERRLERLAHRKIVDFTGAKLLAATGRRALLLHSLDDTEVTFDDARQIAGECPTAELQSFDGFGHSKILYAPPAVHAAASFLIRQQTAA